MKNIYTLLIIALFSLYGSFNSKAQTINYAEDFNDNLAQDWKTSGGNWVIEEFQYFHRYTDGIHMAIYNGSTFFNYTYSASITPGWGNNYGLVLNYVDEKNYYRIELDADPLDIFLYEMKDSIETKLKQGTYFGGGQGMASIIKVTNNGKETTIEVNNKLVFDKVSTTSFPFGKIGLYAWWQPVYFDDVKVSAAATTTQVNSIAKVADLKVYPNPAKGSNIQIIVPTGEMGSTLEIFDNLGKLVLSKTKISGGLVKLSPTEFTGSGMYHVRLTSSTKIHYAKLVMD